MIWKFSDATTQWEQKCDESVRVVNKTERKIQKEKKSFELRKCCRLLILSANCETNQIYISNSDEFTTFFFSHLFLFLNHIYRDNDDAIQRIKTNKSVMRFIFRFSNWNRFLFQSNEFLTPQCDFVKLFASRKKNIALAYRHMAIR